MSEGEKKAIEILTTYKNQILERKPFTYSFIDMQWAINTILDLYKEEKEKNKDIANDLEKYKRECYLQGRNDENKSMLEVIKRHYIRKEKIRAKIEELIKKGGQLTEDERQRETQFYQGKLKALEELLEE